MSSLPRGLRNYYLQLKKSPINLNTRFKKRIKRVNSVNAIREKNWDDRFIYDKIPNYDSSNDKNVLINFNKMKCNSSRKKLANTLRGNPLSFIDNSLYFYRPLSNKTSVLHPLIKGKNYIKTISAKSRDFKFKSNKNVDLNNFVVHSSNAKKFNDSKKDEFFKNKTNFNENNFSNINLINLNNIMKLWDELSVINNYRKLFCVIYKELDDEDKEQLYQRETNELMSIKNDIDTLKNNIQLRLNTIKEIFELNKKLNTEIINKDNNSNEIIINQISEKICTLREHTVSVCKSMKKLKLSLNGIKSLDKYDINIIAEKYHFDKNYLIKMKGELNFLKEGFGKYYFNIKNDQTPFLLKASGKNKIGDDKDPFIHLVPLDPNLKDDIMECSYYIYQELIAYQNEKVNQKILRCISPLKRIILKNNEENQKFVNGKEEKEKEKENNNINNNNNENININNNEIDNNNKEKIKTQEKINEEQSNNNNINKSLNSKKDEVIENDEKTEIKKSKEEKNDKSIEKPIEKQIEIGEEKILKRNDKKFKTGPMGSLKEKKKDYKNILMNYKINERKNDKRKSNINRKKDYFHIDKLIIKKESKNNNNFMNENNINNEEDKKESIKNLDEILDDQKGKENIIQNDE